MAFARVFFPPPLLTIVFAPFPRLFSSLAAQLLADRTPSDPARAPAEDAAAAAAGLALAPSRDAGPGRDGNAPFPQAAAPAGRDLLAAGGAPVEGAAGALGLGIGGSDWGKR